jgi:hypothetical protein
MPGVVGYRRLSLVTAVALALGARLGAQTIPLAAISGRVTDASGAAVAGVEVTATSPALQGARDCVTAATGDFLIPFLPPGEYEIVFRYAGFRELRAARSLRATETSRVDVILELAAAEDSVIVRAEPATVIGQGAALTTSYPARLIDRLPVDRSLRGAILLAPGVFATTAGDDFRIAGAGTYENLYLVDGVNVEEIVFGRPRPFPIEDALEETSVAVTGISAEYGGFLGGVVNAVTRSGGNEISGSLRVTLEDEAWRSLTPYERANLAEDPREDSIVPIYEGTLGGPLRRDKLWYFLAGRRQETTRAETLAYTDIPYQHRNREERLESKLTWSPGAGHTLRLAYGEIDTGEENTSFTSPIMDLASLGSLQTPEDLLSLHYSAGLGRRLFLEAQYSRRRRAPTGLGARTTDLSSGTILRDGSRGGAGWNSPALCAVCGVEPGKLRRAEEEDREYVAKASTLLSGEQIGAHNLVAGVEIADEFRKSNAFQSGSGFVVTATAARIENGQIFPVFLPGGSTFIQWRPIFDLSRGSRFRTSSAFVNDGWDLGAHWRFNLGLRWDGDDSRDQGGTSVGSSSAWSPRLAAAFDPLGDGVWTLDAGFARYVNTLNFHVGDFGSSGGRSANFAYTYGGPAVNDGPGSDLASSGEALAILFDWFFANGGTSRPLRQAPGIPGLNRRVGDDLTPPRSEELSLGVTRRFGSRGFLRLTAVRRESARLFGERADSSTGTVVDPDSGRRFDLRLIENSDKAQRTYEALFAQVDLRLRKHFRLAGSYTLSQTRGNFDGDGSTQETDLTSFPEYGEARWRAPVGALSSDQRHRARVWASADVPLAERWGRLSVSLLERLDSGHAWEAVGEIDSRRYVENPGYVGPPARVPYFFEGRGSRRTETSSSTDVAILYSVPAPALRQAEVFVRLVVVNLFDQSAQTEPGNTAVLTAANEPSRASFDPFVEVPVRGIHWDLAPGFGEALSADDFQEPRRFELALGLRF